MDISWEMRSEATPKLTATAVFLTAAVSMACLFLTIWGMPSWHPAEIAAGASPLVFVWASVLVFFRPRWGYSLGLVAGLIALPWLVQIEVAPTTWSSWLFFNSEGAFPLFAKRKILSVAIIVIAIACSSVRLLPARLWLRNIPLYRRTWPAFAIGFLALALWFVRSVTPYGVPGFAGHGGGHEFRILHVEKRGMHIHETELSSSRDGRVWVLRNDRRLIQYRFERSVARGMMPYQRVITFAQSSELWRPHTPPAKALWSWNAEGWYVVLRDSRLLAFTSEYGKAPPQKVTDLFYEIEKLLASEEQTFAVRDACLGFCYDPVAALGFSILQDRSRLMSRNSPGL
jgi:hypothetical protein